jgi:hypothetical protein
MPTARVASPGDFQLFATSAAVGYDRPNLSTKDSHNKQSF